VRRSRDRGCKGHRILRRVLVGGSHLRTSRAIGFHEQVVKATLAASSRGQRRERDSSARAGDERRKARRRSCRNRARGSCDRGVRGLVGAGAVGRKRPRSRHHTPDMGRCWRGATKGSACLAPIRRSVLECREALGPSIKLHEPQEFVRRPRGESRGVSRERTKYGCTYHRSGGRSWSYASRVLSTAVLARGRGGKNKGASRKEARSIADAGHEPRKGEPVRDRARSLKTLALGRLVGFGSQVLDTTEGVLGLLPARPLREV
jgi:hypothetical protein